VVATGPLFSDEFSLNYLIEGMELLLTFATPLSSGIRVIGTASALGFGTDPCTTSPYLITIFGNKLSNFY